MRILFINRVIGFWRGGGETFELNIANELKGMGCEVEFLLGCRRDGSIPLPLSGYKSGSVYSPYLDPITARAAFKIKGFGKLWLLDKFLWGNRAFAYLYKNMAYDGIFINGMPVLGNKIVKEFKIPTIVMFHGPPDKWFYNSIKKGLFVPASLGYGFLVIKQLNQKALNLELGVTEKSKLLSEEKVEIKRKLGFPASSKIILYVGRLVKIKNVSHLIKSFSTIVRSFPQVYLLIVGGGEEKQGLINLVNSLNLKNKIVFSDIVPYETVYQYYQISDIFALPSSFDNFPNVILEAMVNSLPIVATKVGGIPLLITEKLNGFLVATNDLESFTKHLSLLLQNDALCIEMGRINKDLVLKKYNWKNTASKIIETFKSYGN